MNAPPDNLADVARGLIVLANQLLRLLGQPGPVEPQPDSPRPVVSPIVPDPAFTLRPPFRRILRQASLTEGKSRKQLVIAAGFKTDNYYLGMVTKLRQEGLLTMSPEDGLLYLTPAGQAALDQAGPVPRFSTNGTHP